VIRATRSGVSCTGYQVFANVDDVNDFSEPWSNTQNAATDDANAAVSSANASAKSSTNILRFTDPGLSIPANSEIVGVQVQIRRFELTTTSVEDNEIFLYAAGRVGDNQADAVNWEATATTKTYGGEDDLWGSAVTQADVTATTFGFELKASYGAAGTGDASVEFAQINVCYNPGSGDTGYFSRNPMLVHAGRLMTR